MTSNNPIRNAVEDALNRPGYRFSLHGASTVRHRRRRNSQSQAGPDQSGRASRSRAIPPYVVNNVNDFDLSALATPERLHSVFQILRVEGGPGAGTDGITYSDFDNSEIYEALRHVSRKLVNHEYKPHETRLVRTPKGDGRYRELQLHRILDRVIAKALQLALDSYWRSQLPRLGRDVFDLFATMQRRMRQSGTRFLVVSDIRDCFPSLPIDVVLDCHRRHISNTNLLWLIETIVRGHDGPEHTIGAYQGSPYSPIATELSLHTYLDIQFGTRYREFPFLLRYVDNLNILCRNEREGRETLRFCESVLGEIGLNLKPECSPMNSPMDLRIEHSNRKVLGLNPFWRNEQLHFTIPETAYHDLREGFAKSIIQPNPVNAALSVATGWLNAMGPALTNAVTPTIVDRVINTSRECGFNELRSNPLQETCHQAHNRWQIMADERGIQGDA